jgi:predicted DNA-binding protein
MASVTTSVRLEQKLAQRLERAAARLSRGKNWIVTKALEEYLAKVNQDDLAAEARRQSILVARTERRKKPDKFWDEDVPGWK